MKRMSFVFPDEFYYLLCDLKKEYDRDMTYIIMDAVTDWVLTNEVKNRIVFVNGGEANT